MKALSGYAEWFWLIAKNIKPVENRTWPLTRYIKAEELPYRFYLHASKTRTPREELDFIRGRLTMEQYLEFNNVNWEIYRGYIIGEATAVDEIRPGHIRISPPSPWYFGPCAFLVREGVLYDVPIPCRGKLGFFEPEIDMLAEINMEIT